MRITVEELTAVREALWSVLDSQQCVAHSDAELLSLSYHHFNDSKKEIEMHQSLIKKIDAMLKSNRLKYVKIRET